MKKRIFAAVSLFLILCSILSVSALALDPEPEEPEEPIEPEAPYVDIAYYNCGCTINSKGRAYCSSSAQTAHSDYNIYISVALYRYKDGYWQSYAGPWSGSGTHYAGAYGYYYVVSGYYYCAASAVTVRTSTGAFVEAAYLYSPVRYY